MADLLTEGLNDEEVVVLVDEIIEYFKATAKPRERLARLIDRLGLDALKQAVGAA